VVGTYDQHAQRVLHYTREEAARRNEPRIRPDHLFIGLVREHEGGAAQLLGELGIDLDKARHRVGPIQHPPPLPAGSPGWQPPGFTPKLRESLLWAEHEAERLGDREIQSEHLLLGLLSESIYGGAGLLRICGADPEVAWARAYELLGVQPEQRRLRPEPPPFEWQSSWGPRLEELRRVVPIAETRAGAGHTLTLRSLEDYADGFLIRMRFRTEAQPVLDRGIPDWPPTFTIMPELVFTAIDDKGGRYSPGPASLYGSWGGGGPHQPFGEGEFNPRFSPSLSLDAQLLRLEAIELRWVRREHRANQTQATAVHPLRWSFEVPLYVGRMHISGEESSAAQPG